MIALIVAACGVPAERPASPDAILPHPAGYDEAVHGVPALEDGATCLTCHAVDEGALVQGAVPAAPACHSCHADYPHTEGFGTTGEHGAQWLARPDDCAACHGADGHDVPAERSAGTCTSCHQTYPHADAWDLATGHGQAVFTRRGHEACDTCHPSTDTGGPETGRCASCHSAYPHAIGFEDPPIHSAAWLVDAGASCTSSCHPAQAATAAPRVACASCHDLFPHAEGWPEGHIAVVQTRGEGACARCHEPGTPVGPTMPVSCGATCHGTAP